MRICVFSGSSIGKSKQYSEAAQSLGTVIAKNGYGLVYGGASVGLMGIVADAALKAGGEVIGVLPKALADVEIGHKGLTELHLTSTMHERKAMMADLSDVNGGVKTYQTAV